jgi:L-lactate utilization protein LutB
VDAFGLVREGGGFVPQQMGQARASDSLQDMQALVRETEKILTMVTAANKSDALVHRSRSNRKLTAYCNLALRVWVVATTLPL